MIKPHGFQRYWYEVWSRRNKLDHPLWSYNPWFVFTSWIIYIETIKKINGEK